MTEHLFTATLTLPFTPPSLNQVAGRGSYRTWHRAKRQLQNDLGLAVMQAGLPRGLERVEAFAVLTFPTRRRRDTDNYRSTLSKALGDCLVEGSWVPDDVPRHFDFGNLVIAAEPGPSQTRISLRCWRADG
jgi:hypothetical protein